MRRARSFPPDPWSVAAARRFAMSAVGEVPEEVADALTVMVSELTTNSIRHAGTGFELEVSVVRERIHVGVTDFAGGRPVKQAPGPDAVSGRGLLIVERLADSWGVETSSRRGKTVWFTLARHGRPYARAPQGRTGR